MDECGERDERKKKGNRKELGGQGKQTSQNLTVPQMWSYIPKQTLDFSPAIIQEA